jgi:hypothetical protein
LDYRTLNGLQARRLRHIKDIRRLLDADLETWLGFYSLNLGGQMRRDVQEKVLVRFLGGDDQRPM